MPKGAVRTNKSERLARLSRGETARFFLKYFTQGGVLRLPQDLEIKTPNVKRLGVYFSAEGGSRTHTGVNLMVFETTAYAIPPLRQIEHNSAIFQ